MAKQALTEYEKRQRKKTSAHRYQQIFKALGVAMVLTVVLLLMTIFASTSSAPKPVNHMSTESVVGFDIMNVQYEGRGVSNLPDNVYPYIYIDEKRLIFEIFTNEFGEQLTIEEVRTSDKTVYTSVGVHGLVFNGREFTDEYALNERVRVVIEFDVHEILDVEGIILEVISEDIMLDVDEAEEEARRQEQEALEQRRRELEAIIEGRENEEENTTEESEAEEDTSETEVDDIETETVEPTEDTTEQDDTSSESETETNGALDALTETLDEDVD